VRAFGPLSGGNLKDYASKTTFFCSDRQCFQYHKDCHLAGLEVGLLAEVRLQEGEPLENALRRFKRKVQQEDIIKEVKRHSYYLKPGEKKRVKAALARKRNRKKARKEQD
jgi:small subunit ribosomal protein S21